MKLTLSLFALFLVTSTCLSQTAFRKSYYFPDKIEFKVKISDTNTLVSPERVVKSKSRRENSKKWQIDKVVFLSYSDTTKHKDPIPIALNDSNSNYAKSHHPELLKCNVKFTEDKLYVNPWYIDDSTRNRDYFYKLQNRQMVKLRYQQLTFTAITIPLKVQFGTDNSVNYQTGISVGALFGYSRGRTRFTYRSKLDNFQRSSEVTIGALINVSSLEFKDKYERVTKTASIGIGGALLSSYESLSFGIAGGVEFATGSQSKDWNFNGQPWLGLMFGYSLFDK